MQCERRQAGNDHAELEVAWSQHAAQAIDPCHFRDRAHAMPADRLLDRVDAPEQWAGSSHRLDQRVERPDKDDDRESTERGAAARCIGDRRRDQPQEWQVAQVDRGFADGPGLVDRIHRRQQFRHPVRAEQHAGQRPRRAAEQARAVAEAHQQQARDRRQCTEHHHRFGITGRGPQGNERQHPGRCPTPADRHGAGRGRQFSGSGQVRHKATASPPALRARCGAS